jgi:hypothetical protein
MDVHYPTMQQAAIHDGGLPGAPATPGEAPATNGAALACLEWLAQCSALIVAIDPSLSVDAADRIAGYLWSNERLRNMRPAGAVDFLFSYPEARGSIPTV